MPTGSGFYSFVQRLGPDLVIKVCKETQFLDLFQLIPRQQVTKFGWQLPAEQTKHMDPNLTAPVDTGQRPQIATVVRATDTSALGSDPQRGYTVGSADHQEVSNTFSMQKHCTEVFNTSCRREALLQAQ